MCSVIWKESYNNDRRKNSSAIGLKIFKRIKRGQIYADVLIYPVCRIGPLSIHHQGGADGSAAWTPGAHLHRRTAATEKSEKISFSTEESTFSCNWYPSNAAVYFIAQVKYEKCGRALVFCPPKIVESNAVCRGKTGEAQKKRKS